MAGSGERSDKTRLGRIVEYGLHRRGQSTLGHILEYLGSRCPTLIHGGWPWLSTLRTNVSTISSSRPILSRTFLLLGEHLILIALEVLAKADISSYIAASAAIGWEDASDLASLGFEVAMRPSP